MVRVEVTEYASTWSLDYSSSGPLDEMPEIEFTVATCQGTGEVIHYEDFVDRFDLTRGEERELERAAAEWVCEVYRGRGVVPYPLVTIDPRAAVVAAEMERRAASGMA
jgi:hypothetical protein